MTWTVFCTSDSARLESKLSLHAIPSLFSSPGLKVISDILETVVPTLGRPMTGIMIWMPVLQEFGELPFSGLLLLAPSQTLRPSPMIAETLVRELCNCIMITGSARSSQAQPRTR